ncbi:MAG: methenyltetrahydromethanopterin cyclohydrolase, partial [Burkholderiales bacterium]|nr:methenyltetrahydromethanopterin cyclohydrolase [Burkholderiales bacterium]
KFDLGQIVSGYGTAPLPPVAPDFLGAIGRTNDAILYGGRVHLSVRGSDEAARDLARRLPSRHAPDYGRSFAAIFRAAGFDFYKIDPALFAPAEVWVSNVATGRSWHGGAVDMALLRQLWLEEA